MALDVLNIILISLILIIIVVVLWFIWASWYRKSLRRLTDLAKNAYRDQVTAFNPKLLNTHKIVAFYDECTLNNNILTLIAQWQAIDPSKYLPSKKITAQCKIYSSSDAKLCTPYITVNGENVQNLCIVY